MVPAARAFDRSYRETVVLPSGLSVLLRSILPEDKQTLVRALGRLSPQSRYLRFFTNKSHFTEAELRYLTEVDGENHFAIAAMRLLPDGSEEGLGIARVVRCAGEPTVAEAAVAVIDEVQRQGLGRVLFMRLALAARERGIERIRSEILAENKAIRSIIRQFAPEAHLKHDGYLITVDAPLP
jgi:GNAT superfamily N-acetyltransferase